MRVKLVALFFIGLISTGFGQVHQTGNGWVRLSQQVIHSDSFFDSDSKAISIRTNSLYLTNLTAEYGFTDRLTGYILFPFFSRTTINEIEFNQSGNTNPGSSLNSVGDSEIGVRLAFRKKLPIQVIGFITLGLPFGKKGSVGTETDLQTGDGEVNQLVGIQLRQKFPAFHVSGSLAFNNRSENFSNEIRYGFEVGYAHKKFNLLLLFSSIESLFNDTAPVSLNGIFSNHREVNLPGVEVLYNVSARVGIFASADFIVAGRNTLNAPLLGVGIQLKKL